MEARYPHVSIVVVNHNGREHLQAGLPSLAALDWPADGLRASYTSHLEAIQGLVRQLSRI